jgi:hypothetical protein
VAFLKGKQAGQLPTFRLGILLDQSLYIQLFPQALILSTWYGLKWGLWIGYNYITPPVSQYKVEKQDRETKIDVMRANFACLTNITRNSSWERRH